MDPKVALIGKLVRIFSDAVVDDDERSELRAFLASGELSPSETKAVFETFVATTWKATMDDGRISETELQRLREIIRVLQLDASVLPKEWLAAVRK
jgi:tellurite resistance protein